MDYSIKTERYLLRPPVMDDKQQLFELMSDERLTTFLTWEAHIDVSTTEAVLKSLITAQIEGRGFHWCIIFEGKIIGLTSLIDVRRTIRTWTMNRAELSYWVSPEFQGKGIATEASRAVVAFGFNHLNFHKIIIAHASKNIESKRICEKLGFEQYAHEHDAFQKNGEWNDLLWYERIKN